MIRAAVAAMALAACTHAPIQRSFAWSPCGVRLVGSDAHASYAAAEARIIKALEPHVSDACFRMSGWIVQVVPTPNGRWWIDSWGRQVVGLTSCATFTIQIGNEDWTEALAHEFVHAAAECPDPPSNHEGWAGSWKESFESRVWASP